MESTHGHSPEQDIDFAQAVPEEVTDEALEPGYMILVHDDDVTPYEYVVRLLEVVFLLSEEMADHIAQTAQDEGAAVVMVRPRDEAKRLITIANGRARSAGYPLLFSMEQAA